MLKNAGFDDIVISDFYEPFEQLLAAVNPDDQDERAFTEEQLLEAFNNAEKSNSIVVFLRLILHADEYSPFLTAAPGELEPPTMEEFCNREVDAFGKDADHIQITALATALRVSLDVVYLSSSQNVQGEDGFTFPSNMMDSPNNITACDIVHFDVDQGQMLNIGSLLYRPGHFDLLSGAWDATLFKKNLRVDVTRMTKDLCEFELAGVDASIANALRRALIAEVSVHGCSDSQVPSVAIEHVYIWNNTSIIQDEVLSHRLGLIPLAIDPTKLTFKMVYASQLEWDPKGDQGETMADAPPQPVNPDIVIAKLAPGQGMEMELHCEKGIGKDHAKFSPVATATYRLLPVIDILMPIPEPLIPKFISCFPPGVVEKGGKNNVQVVDARKDTVSREVLRHPEFQDMVLSVESTGVYKPEALLPAAIEVLLRKVDLLKLALDALPTSSM
ncbi:Rpc40p [Malassezia vespertilionis]|uniref:Rpc40p n=1 Tax=Malassezia vespertilionis TaxID=2020962 RepID=A0A2N1J9D1_9BASI|nr:Rpc40p [Malassezia vespertilionis]